MRAKTSAARGLCYQLAASLDRAHRGGSEAERAAALARASLLTPVAKAFASDIGNEVASIGVQVHGGMGYIEETGAAQHMRDARIAGIYEGTNGIQAIDLVTRKLPLEGGAVVRAEIDALRAAVARAGAVPRLAGAADRLNRSIDDLARATAWLATASPEDGLAAATPYLRLFALAAGGVSLLREALAATADEAAPGNRLRIDTALFFAGQIASASGGLAEAVMQGVEALGAPLSHEA
jgi:acyl-CoA dehydrogenase